MTLFKMALYLLIMSFGAIIFSAPTAIAFAAPQQSIEGVWKSPFLGYNWTFEFKQSAGNWTGRVVSDKSNNWGDLKDVTYDKGVLRFSLNSVPVITFNLKLNNAGDMLDGTVAFGSAPSKAHSLKRAS